MIYAQMIVCTYISDNRVKPLFQSIRITIVWFVSIFVFCFFFFIHKIYKSFPTTLKKQQTSDLLFWTIVSLNYKYEQILAPHEILKTRRPCW